MVIVGPRHRNHDLFDRDVLAWEPFQGEEGDIVCLSDLMVVAKKEHACVHCLGPIAKGERVRRRAELNRDENKRMSFYFCAPCCSAMAEAATDQGTEAMMARHQLHRDEVPS